MLAKVNVAAGVRAHRSKEISHLPPGEFFSEDF